MPSKDFTLDNGLVVKIFKRHGSRNLRLTVSPAGHIRVTIPAWTPYRAGLEFAKSRQTWLESQIVTPELLTDGQAVGRAHRLKFEATAGLIKPSSRISGSAVVIKYPSTMNTESPEVQSKAHEASVRALRLQAEQLLPQRLSELAARHEFTYKSVTIKRLKGRWGSCDQHKRIVLNLYLMQLPWELIDYVLLHELTHTQVLKHGPEFWQGMEAVLPSAKSYKKRMREYQPVLDSST